MLRLRLSSGCDNINQADYLKKPMRSGQEEIDPVVKGMLIFLLRRSRKYLQAFGAALEAGNQMNLFREFKGSLHV